MKVLMTVDPIGGVWTYALELCAALEPHGVRVLLATLGQPLSLRQRLAVEALPNVSLRESRYRLEWMEDPWIDLDAAAGWLLALRRQFEPDVVHLNHLAHGALDWQSPVLTVAHSCVLSWWAAVRGEPLPSKWNRYRARVHESLHASNAVVTPSNAMRAALECHYGPLRNTFVISNARDPREFSRGPKEPLILAAGRIWDEAKNVAALDAIAAKLPWPVCIAGSTRSPDGRSARLRASRALGVLGPAELRGWYARAAIYALPARYEPFGLTALEAALSGCALVLGDIPSLREIWGDAAAYVPPENPQALTDTLADLIADSDRRAALAARARWRAMKLSPDRFAAACRRLYRSMLAEERTVACASYSSAIR